MAQKPRSVWVVIPAFERGVLEKVGGKSLLENAICSADLERRHPIKYVFVATHDEEIAGEAQRIGADLPRRLLMDKPEDEDLRSRSFHAVDFLVKETESRIWRWGVPSWFLAIDPFFPQSPVTIMDVYDGCRKSTMAVPVLDIYPGMVMPVWSVYGHNYAPPGVRPHEDYSGFLGWNGEHFTVEMVRVGSLSETLNFRDQEVQSNYNKLVTNRAFTLNTAFGCESMYIPTGKSWGALIPRDAAFVYDAATDTRIYRGDRNGHSSRSKVLQRSSREKED